MIIVFGSINLDLITRVEAIPGPGETTLGGDYATSPGGKGANQALAARRAGAKVAMVGAVGKDAFAGEALALLKADGVDLSATREVAAPTGAAFIAVDAHGENAIVVASGANRLATAAQLDQLAMSADDILVLQRETPPAEVEAAARSAKAKGARVVLNLAPAGPPSEALLKAVDVLIVNEHEALTLGQSLKLVTHEPEEVAAHIDRALGVACIVTLGPAGAVGYWQGGRVAAPAPPVKVVDTTGAGDTFVGAFAAALDRRLSFEAAMRRGLAAGSLACTKPGAQPSMPYVAEIEALVGEAGPRSAWP
ncbi:MAG TPA: ribokinase [Roseiarcus sp.]|nr:ribokinase [Roseiarcus sp.]